MVSLITLLLNFHHREYHGLNTDQVITDTMTRRRDVTCHVRMKPLQPSQASCLFLPDPA
jgi:hypothetical protein